MKVIFLSDKTHRIERRFNREALKGKIILQAIILHFYALVIFLILENQRMVEVEWRGPLEVTWSNPLLKQGHVEEVAQDHVYLQLKQKIVNF